MGDGGGGAGGKGVITGLLYNMSVVPALTYMDFYQITDGLYFINKIK
jgi:hypothetical protein